MKFNYYLVVMGLGVLLFFYGVYKLNAALTTYESKVRSAIQKAEVQDRSANHVADCKRWCTPNAWSFNLHSGCTCRSK